MQLMDGNKILLLSLKNEEVIDNSLKKYYSLKSNLIFLNKFCAINVFNKIY